MHRIMFLGFLVLAVGACGDDDGHEHGVDAGTDGPGGGPDAAPFGQRVYVAHEGSLVSYSASTGAEQPGAVQNVTGPVDIQALADGTIMVNLTGRNEVLVLDGRTMLETTRVASSGSTGTRPVHSYITPPIAGKTYWVALNDGDGTAPTNSAAFIDVTPGSATRFQRVGEVTLGIGHHKATFSPTMARMVASNIGDCDNAMSVYDFSDLGNITTLATLTGAEAGFDHAEPPGSGFDPLYCDPTFTKGLPPAPHGCATAPASGKGYCSITSSGDMVAIDFDSASPTFTLLPTNGTGGGFTLAHPGGRYLYTMQETPREGDGGTNCQIGQVVVTDSMSDTVVTQFPVRYLGPSCADALTGTPAETANPGGHVYFSHDGNTLFIPANGGFNVTDARVNQVIVLDTANPASPVQLESITVGMHTGHSASALSGDGTRLFVVNVVDGSVSVVDTASRAVSATITVEAMPKTVATYGSAEGPGHQVGPIE